jgi:hypothetical protein
MNNYEGFIGVLIIIVGIVSVGSMFSSCLFADTQRHNAETEARVWVHEMFPDVPEEQVHISCQAQDTDQNGYVTCSSRVADERLSLECYAYVFMNIGGNTCREMIPVRAYGAGRSR